MTESVNDPVAVPTAHSTPTVATADDGPVFGYAVLVEHWTGDKYTPDYGGIMVYLNKVEAEHAAQQLEMRWGAEVRVNIIDAEIRRPTHD